MDLVTLIAACSLAASANTNTTLYHITQTVDANAYYIDDLTDAAVYQPTTLDEAAGITRALVEAGHDVRVGLTQVPARESLRAYSITPQQLLDPCTNIALGSDRLSVARDRHGDKPLEVLSWYLTDSTTDGVGISWANDVLAQPSVDIQAAATRPDKAPPSPRFSSPDQRLFIQDADSNADSNPRPHPSATITPKTYGADSPKAKSSAEPSKWAPSSRNSGQSKASNSVPSSTRSGNHDAQPDVTAERLPTSDELDQSEEATDE